MYTKSNMDNLYQNENGKNMINNKYQFTKIGDYWIDENIIRGT